MGPGARKRFGAPMFEPKVFSVQMLCIEENACEMRPFSACQWLGAWGIVHPLPPLVMPLRSWDLNLYKVRVPGTDLYVVRCSETGPHREVSSRNTSCWFSRTSHAAVLSHPISSACIVEISKPEHAANFHKQSNDVSKNSAPTQLKYVKIKIPRDAK